MNMWNKTSEHHRYFFSKSLCYSSKIVNAYKFTYALPLIFVYKKSILVNAVLGGKVAVSCNSQSALARLNPFSEVEYM